MSKDKRLSFLFVCFSASEEECEREMKQKLFRVNVCCPVSFSQDRGLERPHISNCCQTRVRGRDSEGQLFSMR